MKINVRLTYADGQTHEYASDEVYSSIEDEIEDFWNREGFSWKYGKPQDVENLRKVEILGPVEESAP